MTQGNKSLEDVRNEIRRTLNAKDKDGFPYGYAGTSVSSLASEVFHTSVKISEAQKSCTNCEYTEEPIKDKLSCVISIDSTSPRSTSLCLKNCKQDCQEQCMTCFSDLTINVYYNPPPGIFMFDHSTYKVKPSKAIKFVVNGKVANFKLRGLIYLGDFHFTARFVTSEGNIWYHDGKDRIAKTCIPDGHIKQIQEDDYWQTCRGRSLVMSIYSKN